MLILLAMFGRYVQLSGAATTCLSDHASSILDNALRPSNYWDCVLRSFKIFKSRIALGFSLSQCTVITFVGVEKGSQSSSCSARECSLLDSSDLKLSLKLN
uniref:Secreted protein n=1 Tax=Rhipicephalus appendiculatus TaxID=34631 RepID=A0A131YEA7_RHIAP